MQYIESKAVFYKYLAEHCHCINARQSPAERRAKYRIVRLLGGSKPTAVRLRDWNYNSIARYFGYRDYKHLVEVNG